MKSAKPIGLILPTILAALGPVDRAWSCPKLLMFDGPSIRSEMNDKAARYWGRTIGLQGLFLNDIMADWQTDVASGPASPAWSRAKEMQGVYAREGVTDNFIKVAIWRSHDWRDELANKSVAANFGHAAALARFAGFRGIALDTEPYVPIWGGPAGGDEIAGLVRQEGKRIGEAMRAAYPGMTLVILKDALLYASLREGYNGGYQLAVPFLQGLLSADFPQVVIAEEQSYKDMHVAATDADVRNRYTEFLRGNKISTRDLSVAPGLWPLGKSYLDKSARMSSRDFGQELGAAYSSAKHYVWIYGFGSAWDPDGTYKGALDNNFGKYVAVLQREVSRCRP
ncbi:MAG: hypothetical protein ACREHF_12990 [Rhizomicrobium sp.]